MADVTQPTDPSRQDGRSGQTVYHPDLEWRQTVRGAKPGDRYVRIATHRGFTRIGKNYLVPRPGTGEPVSGFGRGMQRLKHLVLGSPIPTASEVHQRLNKIRALAVFSSDALSSVAYATEEIMKVLVLGGAALLYLTLPISLVIIALLAIIVISLPPDDPGVPERWRRYIVAHQNLGASRAWLRGVALDDGLRPDGRGVRRRRASAAITSAVPRPLPYRAELSVGAVALLAVANLRGLREAGTIFAGPDVCVCPHMCAHWVGMFRIFLGGGVSVTSAARRCRGAGDRWLFLLLAAFAQGCTAMTGTEAISDGVLAFKPPESPNARKTLRPWASSWARCSSGCRSWRRSSHRAGH